MNEYCEWCGQWIPLEELADGSYDDDLERYIYLCKNCHPIWCKQKYGEE